MLRYIQEPVKRVARKVLFPVPKHLSENFISIQEDGASLIKASLEKNYHTGWRSKECYSPEAYKADIAAHLHERLESDRKTVIPWIDDACSLKNKNITEIGCGTGSSSIAFAEQGARVTGVDIDDGALLVAKQRAKVYEVNAEFKAMNAQEIRTFFEAERFDMIVFFACLEHMTIDERLSSLKDSWDMLPSGGLLIITETPNRLWYFDSHTSRLPFFNWLPNELAFLYSKFSSRENFKELYTEYNELKMEHFLRRGRGVSFHEIEMTIDSASKLNILSSLSSFEGWRYKAKKTWIERKYKSVLTKMYPHIHEGFFDDYLYLIIEK